MFRRRPAPDPQSDTADATANADSATETAGDPEEAITEERSAAADDSMSEETATATPDSKQAAVATPRGGWRRWLRRDPSEPAESDQPVATDGATGNTSGADESSDTEKVADAGEGAAGGESTEGADVAEVADEESPTETIAEIEPVPRKPIGKRLTAAVIVSAVVFVGAGAFAGAMLQPYLADKASVNTKLEIARTATNAITTLWTYTPDNMDSLADRSAKYLAGDFKGEYRKYIDAIAPVNKQAKVSNNTQVVGAAVESLEGRDATAVVYTNTTNSSPQSHDIPSMRYLSYRLTMQRHGSHWLITKMTTITSLDLTPQLG